MKNFSAEETYSQVQEAVHEHERTARAEVVMEGRRFTGMSQVLARSWKSVPSTAESRGRLWPRFAARDPVIMAQAISEWKSWIAAYRRAVTSFREKVRDVVFPAGTYLMRVLCGVNVAGLN
jgi:hypothetical protein